MKIIVSKLLHFLELINLGGAIEMKELILTGSKTELKTCAKVVSGVFALKASLKADYSEIETVGIGDLSLLRKVIELNKNSKDEVTLDKKENTIIIKNKDAKVKLLLRNPQYILTALNEEKYKEKVNKLTDNKFTLTKDNIAQIIKYYDIMKGKVRVFGDKNVITFIMGEKENQSEIKITVPETVKEFEAFIEGFFIDILHQVADNAVISIVTDNPILISIKKDESEIEYLLAPLKR